MDRCETCDGWLEPEPCTCLLWIPVEERMPRREFRVLGTQASGRVRVVYWRAGVWYLDQVQQEISAMVTAWQPLPRPWKGLFLPER